MFAVVLVLQVLLFNTISLAQDQCTFSVSGKQLERSNGKLALYDGSEWQLTDAGLYLKFNGTNQLYGLAIQTRTKKQIRLVAFDNTDNMFNHFINIETGDVSPEQVKMVEIENVDKVFLQGLNLRQVKDIDIVQITACPNTCFPMEQCYGECIGGVKDGCMQCVCPEGSMSEGCVGYPSERDLNLLWALVQRKIIGCQFVNGYRRQIDKDKQIDDCVPFSYPRCDFYREVKIPRTKDECYKSCYGGEHDNNIVRKTV